MRDDIEMKPFFVALLVVSLLWLTNLILPLLMGSEVTSRGTFGDMFGAVNSLFSGAAFVGVVYAILLQRREVEIAREELSRTKSMMEAQSEALKVQNQSAERKNFEETFFQLLSMHNAILNSIDLQGANLTSGRDVFSVMLKRLGSDSKWDYENFFSRNGQELGHYFRWLYNIFKFIEAKAPESNEKFFYGNLVRAQMSDKEVALLFFNGLSPHGEKFKPLIEKYRLLKHIKKKDIQNSPAKATDYLPSAYGL